jgi:hypothetical protein
MPMRLLALWAASAAVLAAPLAAGAAPNPAPDAAVVREAERRMDLIDKNQALASELAGMGAVDQLVRNRWLELRKTADEPTRAALKDVWDRRIRPIDEAHVRRLKTLLAARDSWFRQSEVGPQAALAAFLIVQHSDDIGLQKTALASMEPLLAPGEMDKGNYALLWDRIAVTDGRPQRYATQGTDCDGDRYVTPRDLEDPAGLDARRAAMGLEPMSQYLTRLNEGYGRCEVPPVMRNRAKAN